MNTRLISFFIIGVTLFMVCNITNSGFASENDINDSNYPNSPNQCLTATAHVYIAAASDNSLAYNESSLEVPKATCVAITFENSAGIEHTFTIDASSMYNTTLFNIGLMPGTNATSNYLTPNTDVTFQYYCEVPGHRAGGMYGSLIIGKGSPKSNSPGFEIIPVFVGLIVITLSISYYRKKKIE